MIVILPSERATTEKAQTAANENAKFKGLYREASFIQPKKIEGVLPKSLGKPGANKQELGVAFKFYGGKNDKIRRVVQGNPRPALSMRGVRITMHTRVPGFLFGKIDATSIARVPNEIQDQVLFVCSYVEHNRTIIQLEDLKKHEVLDSCVLEGFRGKLGVTCLQMVNAETVIGIFSGQLLKLGIRNKKFTSPLFFSPGPAQLLGVCQPTQQIAIFYADKTISTGKLCGSDFQEETNFKPTLFEEVTSLDFRINQIILGSKNGSVVSFRRLGQSWVFGKTYFNYDRRISNVHYHHKKDLVSISGDDHIILIYLKGKLNKFKLPQQQNGPTADKRIIYMEKLEEGLLYMCNNGEVGVLSKTLYE